MITVVDGRNGASLTIQTAAAAADAGHFVFRVPGLGHYVGEAGLGMRVLSPTSVVVRWRGQATLRPEVAWDGTISGTVRSPIAVSIEIQAQVDPAHQTAEATLREGPRRYQLVAPAAARGDLERAMRAVEAAFLADDPAALYPYANGDLRAAYTPEAFAAAWRAQASTIGRVTAMRATAVSDPETNELGFVFVTATYEVERITPAGTTETKAFDVLFVREGDSWKLLFSRPK